MRYEIVNNEVYIYNDNNELIIYQNVNPFTGEKIKSEQEAEQIAFELMKNYNQSYSNLDA